MMRFKDFCEADEQKPPMSLADRIQANLNKSRATAAGTQVSSGRYQQATPAQPTQSSAESSSVEQLQQSRGFQQYQMESPKDAERLIAAMHDHTYGQLALSKLSPSSSVQDWRRFYGDTSLERLQAGGRVQQVSSDSRYQTGRTVDTAIERMGQKRDTTDIGFGLTMGELEAMLVPKEMGDNNFGDVKTSMKQNGKDPDTDPNAKMFYTKIMAAARKGNIPSFPSKSEAMRLGSVGLNFYDGPSGLGWVYNPPKRN